MFKNLDFKVSYKTKHFVQNLLKNPKRKTDYLKILGIYELNCNDCSVNHFVSRRRTIKKAAI